jgi:hypothetical protein
MRFPVRVLVQVPMQVSVQVPVRVPVVPVGFVCKQCVDSEVL